MTVGEFSERVVALAGLFQLSATSWGRTRNRNAAVGGAAHSPHLVWLGADLVGEGEVPEDFLVAMGMRLGLKVIPEGDHYHVQPWDWLPG